MPELTIDRLTLQIAGIPEDDGRRLARLIAEGLAAAPLQDGAQNRPALQSNQTASAGTSLQDLSTRIVADLLQQLI